MSNHHQGILYIVVAIFLFSLKSIFIKLAYAESMTADSVLFWRMLISLPFYLLVLLWLMKNKTNNFNQLRPFLWKIISVGFLGYYLASYLDLWGLEFITTQLERLTLFTYPLMIAVLGTIFFKRHLTKK